MDLTKGLKLTNLREGNLLDKEIIEFFYQKAYKATDCDEREKYANRALFKSSSIAFQEFLKFNQKEIKSGTFSRGSGSTITTLNRGSMGVSSSRILGRMRSEASLGEWGNRTHDGSYAYSRDNNNGIVQLTREDSRCVILGTNDSSYKFLTEFPESRNPETILQLYSFLRNLVNNKSDKLFVAFLVFNSEYDRWLTEVQAEFFSKEFDFFDKIKTSSGKVNYCSLWNEVDNQLKFLGYKLTRYKIDVAKTDILKRARQLQIKQSIF